MCSTFAMPLEFRSKSKRLPTNMTRVIIHLCFMGQLILGNLLTTHACTAVRFCFPMKKGQHGYTLLIEGEVCSDSDKVLRAWSAHFRHLSASHESGGYDHLQPEHLRLQASHCYCGSNKSVTP